MVSRRSGPDVTDWAVVRQRLKSAMDATAGRWEPSVEARQTRREAVARALSRPNGIGDDVAAVGSIVFEVADRRYVMEARYVSEVVPLGTVTPVPRAPDYVMGLYNLRGQLLPIFLLHRLVGAAGSASSLPWAIVCGQAEPEFLIATSSMASAAPDFPNAGEQGRETTAVDWISGETADGTVILDGAGLLAEQTLFPGEPADDGNAEVRENGQ